MVNIGLPSDGVPDQGWKLYITSLIMVIAAGLFVIARCTTRYMFQKLGWDDYAIIFSLAFSIFLSVAIQVAVANGYGKHKVDLEIPELKAALRWFFIAQTPYKVVVCLNKSSAILMYLRVFITRNFKIAAYTVMAIIVAWSIGATGATIFQCIPIQGSWDKSIDARCIDSDVFWIAYSVVNILTDVMVLALPIPPIFSLQLKPRDRLMLCVIFLMGGFVTITSIMRATAVSNSLRNREDLTWNFITRGIWTLIEANAGIISACLPILKQPLGRLFPRLFGSNRSSHYYANDIGRPGKHYQLTNLSAQESKPSFRNDPPISRMAPVTVPASKFTRKSDEQYIITRSVKRSDSEIGSTGTYEPMDISKPLRN